MIVAVAVAVAVVQMDTHVGARGVIRTEIANAP
jgi:hypothetical protein